MPHIKIEPMKELEYLTSRIRKFAEEFPETFSFEFGSGFEPKIDLVETDATMTVFVELAGVVKEDISLSLRSGKELEIAGTKQPGIDPDTMSIVRSERTFGEFSRMVILPADADGGSVEAELNNGVLIVTLRKLAAKQSSEIKVDIK
jgi:HSP20 family protein